MIRSAAWYASTRVWMGVLQWGVGILLARLLMPKDYGLFAMALSVVALLELLQSLGLGVSIVQRQDLKRRHHNAIFWTMLALSVGIALVATVAASVAAHVYNEPRLIWMVRLLAISFIFDSFGMVPYNLLTKEIEFRGRSLAEAIAVVVSSLVALALGYFGFAFWALVIAHVIRSFVRSIGMAVACRWWPGLEVGFEKMREIVVFGLRVTGAHVIQVLAGTVQTGILGRSLGAGDLGIYSMASSLGKRNPLHKVSTSVLNQLSLPVFSKLQHDDAYLRRHFLKLSKYLAAIAIPLQLGMALVALDIVLLLLTAKWLAIVPFVRIFAVGGILDIMPLPSTPLLTARGKSKMLVRLAMFHASVMTLAYFVGSHWGLMGVAVAWFGSFIIVRAVLLWLSLREIQVPVREYFGTIAPPVLAALGMTAVVLLLQPFVPGLPGSVERLSLTVGAGAVAYGTLLLLLDRSFGRELRGILLEMLPWSSTRKADA
jgi:O-antigen/teichoic acid export membrane protein